MNPLTNDLDVLSNLHTIWDQKPVNYGRLLQSIRNAFANAVNPYSTAIYFIKNAQEYYEAKSTGLSFIILKEFNQWISSHCSKYANFLNEPEKKEAFLIGTGAAHFTYFDLIVKSFQLCHNGNEYLLQFIRQFITEKRYKAAGTCVLKLHLQKYFSIKEIILPLILQGEFSLVEGFINKHDQQVLSPTELVKLLDGLIADKQKIIDIIRELGMPNVNWDKLKPKVLSKMTVRLMEANNIPLETCPNVEAERKFNALSFLLILKYREKSLSGSPWFELVECIVKSSVPLQMKLVNRLVAYSDINEAAAWARHYQLPAGQLPRQVVEVLNRIPEPFNYEESLPTVAGSSREFYSLSLPRDAVHWVHDISTFNDCVRSLSEQCGPFGIDAEWRPNFGQTFNPRLSIFQMASRNSVYILDILSLQNDIKESDWLLFGCKVLASNAVKLGYGVSEDLHMLTSSVPCLKPILGKCRILDLHSYDKKNKKRMPVKSSERGSKLPGAHSNDEEKKKPEKKGLSEMVRSYLGRPLDKSQQMSDWERRPLREAQILYAALDAFCLIEIYEAFKSQEGKLLNLNSCSSSSAPLDSGNSSSAPLDSCSSSSMPRT